MATMETTTHPLLMKLNGINWTIWKPRMEDLLCVKDLEAPLRGGEAKPEKMTDEDWKRMDRKALSVIRSYVDDCVYHHVATETTAKGLWEKLHSLYERKTATNKAFLMRKLVNLKYTEGSSIAEHLNQIQSLINQLSTMKISLGDEMQALFVLSSLPASWETLVVSLSNSSPEGVVSMAMITSSLLNEELRRSSCRAEGSSVDESGALIARDAAYRPPRRSNGEQPYRKDFSNYICYHCQEKGHIQWQCKKMKADLLEFKKSKEKGKEQVINFAEEDEEKEAMVLMALEPSNSTQSWCLDSGASHHICPTREAFLDFKSVKEEVETADGSKMAVEGVGTVKMVVHDGQVRTFGDVRYIPTARRSLISLGRLDEKGCSIETHGGVMKIMLRGKEMLRGMRRRDRTYKLVGRVIGAKELVHDEEQSIVQGVMTWADVVKGQKCG